MKYQNLVHAATCLTVFLAGTALASESQPNPIPEKAAEVQATRARALKEGWPDTTLGMVASGWIEAFSSGADVMRQFLQSHMSEQALASRPIEKRMNSYPALREQFGNLMLAEVRESSSEELTVMLLAEDTTQYHFVFTADPEAPHMLVSVRILQYQHGHGGH